MDICGSRLRSRRYRDHDLMEDSSSPSQSPRDLLVFRQTMETDTFLLLTAKNNMDTPAIQRQTHRDKHPAAPRPIPQALYPSCETQTSCCWRQRGRTLLSPFRIHPDNKRPSAKSLWP